MSMMEAPQSEDTISPDAADLPAAEENRIEQPAVNPESHRAVDHVLQEVPESLKKIRAEIIEAFPPESRSGLNTARAEQQIQKLGLPVKDYFIFEGEDEKRATEILRSHGFDADSRCEGTYYAGLGMAIVRRRRDLEEINGPQYTERQIVHELVHGTAQNLQIAMYKDGSSRLARSGSKVYITDLPQEDGEGAEENHSRPGTWGNFLEEGFAGMIDGEYAIETRTPESVKRLVAELGGEIEADINLPDGAGKARISAWHMFSAPGGKVGTSIASIAGTGLSRLCEKNPALRAALVEARGSVDGMRKAAQIIEGIKPGLYGKLQRLRYSEKDFVEGTQLVQSL